jgi:hypothetical protein
MRASPRAINAPSLPPAPFKVSPADLNEVIGETDKIITASYQGRP